MRFDGCGVMFYKQLSYHLYADVHLYLKVGERHPYRPYNQKNIIPYAWCSNHYLALLKILYALLMKHLLPNIWMENTPQNSQSKQSLIPYLFLVVHGFQEGTVLSQSGFK